LKLIDQNQNKLNNKKMGKSKVRGGAKAHRKRVENRNQNIKTQQSAIQKLFSETMKLQMEEFKKKQESEQDGTSEPQQ
jgi:putative hemolysin